MACRIFFSAGHIAMTFQIPDTRIQAVQHAGDLISRTRDLLDALRLIEFLQQELKGLSMYLRMRYSVIRNIPPQVLVEIATFLSLQDRLLSKNLFICKTWSETLSGSYARQTLSRPEYRGLIFHRKEPLPWYQLSGEAWSMTIALSFPKI